MNQPESSPITALTPQQSREQLAGNLRLQGLGCRSLGSDFYGDLLDRMADDAESGGVVWELLGPHAAASFGEAYPLRLLGGVHRMVLAGNAPDLARHYETAGGDGDIAAAWPWFRQVLDERAAELVPALDGPPQTNEVGRSVALLAGLMVVTAATGLPVRLLEIGSSAGLNLLLDRYYYRQDGFAWGDAGSPVCFDDLWRDGNPPLDVDLTISSRRGCDRNPIDVTDPAARDTLVSYVWPGQTRRFELLRNALDVATASPPPVDAATVTDWLPGQLQERHESVVTVAFHSIMWSYLTDDERETVESTIVAAGERATADAPLAWLRMEAPPEIVPAQLRLQLWPGGAEDRLLANCDYHLGPVRWRAAT